jgi:hypothetical protein
MFVENEATTHHANAMTRRFSEFATSFSILMTKEISDLMTPEMRMVAATVINLLEQTSRELPGNDISVIFFINNYYLIILTLSTLNGCVLVELFKQKLTDCTAHYIDLELVNTVRREFTKLETREEPHAIGIGEVELKEIALEFKTNHMEKMKLISDAQMM